ncbi:MFS general substrate transporter [Saitoella complicata NRRL Y-17804]|nr:MFS general substrate transporter [Saitoella complicata NRRL Y-17804]ODQ53777.1 MFS general substrate transporter [Saitoella complicata NRRL Y-17804]
MVTASTSVIFEDKYGLNETEVGLTFLANGTGCLVGSILQGRILDWDYRITKARWEREGHHENEADGDDSFPIERARLRSLWWLCLCFGGGCIAYGWTIEKRVHISAPLIFQFIIGYSATSIFNTFGTLVVDLFPGRGSSATAANNFVRCALGAVGTAVVDEMLGSRLGAGWGFVVLIGVCACCSPLVWVVLRFGPGWRGERMRREREKANAKAAAGGK